MGREGHLLSSLSPAGNVLSQWLRKNSSPSLWCFLGSPTERRHKISRGLLAGPTDHRLPPPTPAMAQMAASVGDRRPLLPDGMP